MLFVGQWTSAHVVAKGERERDIYIEREYIYIYIERERERERSTSPFPPSRFPTFTVVANVHPPCTTT
jgi:hypothetical protein